MTLVTVRFEHENNHLVIPDVQYIEVPASTKHKAMFYLLETCGQWQLFHTTGYMTDNFINKFGIVVLNRTDPKSIPNLMAFDGSPRPIRSLKCVTPMEGNFYKINQSIDGLNEITYSSKLLKDQFTHKQLDYISIIKQS